ncbi:MAG: GAF domain-containing protein [Deltaproteobacteria bacterium]|nr:GAF domain-containing protein [Deltaproteobacteria bacterium]
MQFYWLPPFLAGVLDLFLGLLVVQRAPHRTLNQIFALFALSLMSWNFDIATLYFFTDYERALKWSEFFRYGMLFIPPTVYHLALALTGRRTVTSRLFLATGYCLTLVLCLANGRGVLVQRLESFTWGYYPVGSPLYKIHTLSDLLYFGATLYQLVRGFTSSESPRQREQLKLVLLGLAVALPVGLTNLLPVYGISIYPLGNLGNVFLCGALTCAIVRHGLLDVELIITKTTAGVVALVLWLIPLWILTAAVQRQIYGASDARLLLFALVVFVLSGLAFPWLLHVSERGVRRLLWGQKYDSLQALSAFQKTIIRVLDQKKILQDLREVLVNTVQAEFVAVYLRQPATGAYADPQDMNAVFLPADPFLHALDQQQEPVVREEVMLEEQDPEAIRLATTMAERHSEVCVPLHAQGRLIGFVLLGKKRNRDIFSAEDLRLLSTLGAEVAVALENARLYDELRTSQIMLARSDRVAAVGTLAAGIAHEIRNPLVAVQTFVQLLPERLDDPEFRATFLELTNSELGRVSTLINDLMTFARPSPTTVEEVKVNDLVDQVVRLLAGQARKRGVTLTARLSPAVPPLVIDQGQIKQVFMNLLLNALQATDAGGTVTVTTSPVQGPDGREYCEIEVQDTGEGIPTERKEQIFDPFFTTKDTGVGLGLFITHQIIKEHGGSIDVESTVGQGTRFLVRLPLAGVPPQDSTLNETGDEQSENATSPPSASHIPDLAAT